MMSKYSAIQEYYRCCEELRLADKEGVSNEEIYRLLCDVRGRCKP